MADVEIRGQLADFFVKVQRAVTLGEEIPQEFLIEGPGGTGKSWGVEQAWLYLAEEYPGMRMAWVRHTRKSHTDSTQQTWEAKVAGRGHKCIHGTAERKNRTNYLWPEARKEVRGKVYEGRSEIVIAGMDNAENLFSTEWDVIWVEEAKQLMLKDYESLLRANRNNHMPFQLLVATTNPGPETHWLNQRPEQWREPDACPACENEDDWREIEEHEGVGGCYECRDCQTQVEVSEKKMERVVTTHKDNPAYWDVKLKEWTKLGRKYLRGLRAMSGALFSQLYKGLWVGEQGMVLSEFDKRIHLLTGHMTDHPEGGKWLHVKGWEDPVWLRWFAGGMDFGYVAAGALVICGYDAEGNSYQVAEVYRTGWDLDRWGAELKKLCDEFNPVKVVCDSAEPRSVEKMNTFISTVRGRDEHHRCIGAVKTHSGPGKPDPAIQLLKWKLRPNDDARRAWMDEVDADPEKPLSRAQIAALEKSTGKPCPELGRPRLFYLKDSLRGGRDSALKGRSEPTCAVEEIGGIVWRETKEGQATWEQPAPDAPDHAFDARKYVEWWAWNRDLGPLKKRERLMPGSIGFMLGKKWA